MLMNVVFGIHQRPLEIKLYDVEKGVLMQDGNFVLGAFPVIHRGPGCFGYTFEEKPRHPFLAAKADALGVPQGPERGQLVRGQCITLADGTVIHPDEVLGPEQPGARLVFVGDAGTTKNLAEIVRDADTLVIEATYLDQDQDMARKFGHLTARQAAELARDANVTALILTHISRRYYERDVLAEAKSIFENTFIARDLDHFQIAKGGDVRRVRET